MGTNYEHMKYYILLMSLGLGLSIQSCNATRNKEAQNNTEEIVQKTDTDKMIAEGFKKGTITPSKTGECPYILSVEGYKEDYLDPINLKDYYKGTVPFKVWVKFTNLRMKNRCAMARPVSINEIEERSE